MDNINYDHDITLRHNRKSVQILDGLAKNSDLKSVVGNQVETMHHIDRYRSAMRGMRNPESRLSIPNRENEIQKNLSKQSRSVAPSLI